MPVNAAEPTSGQCAAQLPRFNAAAAGASTGRDRPPRGAPTDARPRHRRGGRAPRHARRSRPGSCRRRAARRAAPARAPSSRRRSISRSSPSHPSPVAADSATVWVLRCAWFSRLSRSAGSSRSILFRTSISPSSARCPSPRSPKHGEHVRALGVAVRVMRVAHMHDDIGLGDLFQRRAKRRDEMGRQVGDKADRIREDRLPARRQIEAPHRRVERREQQVLGGDLRAGQAIEQRRFPGIRIPDQRNDRIGHAPARLAMQRAGALDVVELPAQPGDALADQPAVDFELALARSAEKSETAALAFEMRPRPDQPRTLVRQCRQFDLQAAFMSARAGAENLEDQAGAVDNLGLPAPFQIALLHRASASRRRRPARSRFPR